MWKLQSNESIARRSSAYALPRLQPQSSGRRHLLKKLYTHHSYFDDIKVFIGWCGRCVQRRVTCIYVNHGKHIHLGGRLGERTFGYDLFTRASSQSDS